jgi:predicted transcriptional regulator
MSNNVRDTSREAFAVEQPRIESQRRAVLAVICKRGNATIAEIAATLNIEKSSVSARVNELKGGSARRPMKPAVREVAGEKRHCKVTGHRAISVELIPVETHITPMVAIGEFGQSEMVM